jgi:DNA repair exonuclease SbcCD ATPase subunit
LTILTVLSAIIEISLGIDMKCTIRGTSWYGVTGNECQAQGLVITEPNQTITSINGQTGSYYHSQNVKSLIFDGQTMNFMPKGLEKLFPQIEAISISSSKLKELKKEDLAPFPMLKNLWTNGNDLETLPSNLFEANPELTRVEFYKEKLKFVGENILSPLKKLKWAYFRGNPCINMMAHSKAQIPALIEELQSKCKPPQGIKTEPQEEPETTTVKDLESIVDSQNKSILDLNSKLDENVKNLEKFNESFDSAKTNLSESQLKVEELESKLVESSHLREENENLKKQVKFDEVLSKKAEKEIEDLKLAIDELKIEKTELKLELNAAKSDVKTERKECKQQLDLIREIQNELKSQWNTTCVLKTTELQNNFEFKLQEIAEMKENLQRKEAENEKLKKENNILRGIQN